MQRVLPHLVAVRGVLLDVVQQEVLHQELGVRVEGDGGEVQVLERGGSLVFREDLVQETVDRAGRQFLELAFLQMGLNHSNLRGLREW